MKYWTTEMFLMVLFLLFAIFCGFLSIFAKNDYRPNFLVTDKETKIQEFSVSMNSGQFVEVIKVEEFESWLGKHIKDRRIISIDRFFEENKFLIISENNNKAEKE